MYMPMLGATSNRFFAYRNDSKNSVSNNLNINRPFSVQSASILLTNCCDNPNIFQGFYNDSLFGKRRSLQINGEPIKWERIGLKNNQISIKNNISRPQTQSQKMPFLRKGSSPKITRKQKIQIQQVFIGNYPLEPYIFQTPPKVNKIRNKVFSLTTHRKSCSELYNNMNPSRPDFWINRRNIINEALSMKKPCQKRKSPDIKNEWTEALRLGSRCRSSCSTKLFPKNTDKTKENDYLKGLLKRCIHAENQYKYNKNIKLISEPKEGIFLIFS